MSDRVIQSEQHARLIKLLGYLEYDPGNRELVLEMVRLALSQGEVATARSALAKALTSHPDDSALVFQDGLVALACGENERAAAIFGTMLRQGEVHPAVYYNAAFALFREGRHDDALEHLASINAAQRTELVPDSAKLEARCLHFLERSSKALPILEAEVATRPHDAEAWGLLSLIAYDDDRNAQAENAAHRALELQADNPDALLTLGSLALERHRGEDAQGYFEMLIEQVPQHGRGWSGLGFAQSLRFQRDAAEASFQRAVHYMPNHIGTWHGLAWLQILRKDFVGAEHSARQAMAIDRNFADSHGTLAVIAIMHGGREEEAKLMIRRAFGLDRNCASALYAQTLLQAKQNLPHANVEELLTRISAAMQLPSEHGLQAMTQKLVQQAATKTSQKRTKP